MPRNFLWSPNGKAPVIQDHTKKKLEILREYIDIYFDTIASNPRVDRLNIALIDGFSGGGHYQDGNDSYPGSPIIMLQAAEEAQKRLNKNRENH